MNHHRQSFCLAVVLEAELDLGPPVFSRNSVPGLLAADGVGPDVLDGLFRLLLEVGQRGRKSGRLGGVFKQVLKREVKV